MGDRVERRVEPHFYVHVDLLILRDLRLDRPLRDLVEEVDEAE